MLTLAVKPQLVHYKLDKTIERPCGDLLIIHHRKCIHSRMEIFSSPMGGEITTHGECVPPLQSVKLS
jgi:hypothetical protein